MVSFLLNKQKPKKRNICTPSPARVGYAGFSRVSSDGDSCREPPPGTKTRVLLTSPPCPPKRSPAAVHRKMARTCRSSVYVFRERTPPPRPRGLPFRFTAMRAEFNAPHPPFMFNPLAAPTINSFRIPWPHRRRRRRRTPINRFCFAAFFGLNPLIGRAARNEYYSGARGPYRYTIARDRLVTVQGGSAVRLLFFFIRKNRIFL